MKSFEIVLKSQKSLESHRKSHEFIENQRKSYETFRNCVVIMEKNIRNHVTS